MYIVVYGYCGPDNYTSRSGPLLEIKTLKTADEVLALHYEFREESAHKDLDQHVFRVFEGKELKLIPVETVTKYKLGS